VSALLRAGVLALLLASGQAYAVYSCGGVNDTCQCGRNNPYPCCDNGGNCTWWAWHSACCNWGIGLPGWGNANQWAGNASANGSYAVVGYAVAGAVTCRTYGAYGHVAYATGVNGSTLYVSEQNCWGNYGTRNWTYNSNYFNTYILPYGHLRECNPGDTQVQGCGLCGIQSRGCGGNGRWGGWSGCNGQGVCSPGQAEARSCGDCGQEQRTCTGQCQWPSGWSACEGDDPPGPLACDSGLKGECQEGRVRCVQGNLACVALRPPRAEVCDGTDDDCDGEADEDAPVQAGITPPPLAAEWTDGAWPRTLADGDRGEAWLSFRNVGSVTWRRGELSVRPDAVQVGGPSKLLPPEGWPAVDAAAVLSEDVPPGALAVFRFPVVRAPGSGDVTERFTLVGPGGRAVACPTPTAEIAVASAPARREEAGHASARPSSCAGALLLPWVSLVPAFRRRRAR
jgi:hypothetical protein